MPNRMQTDKVKTNNNEHTNGILYRRLKVSNRQNLAQTPPEGEQTNRYNLSGCHKMVNNVQTKNCQGVPPSGYNEISALIQSNSLLKSNPY